VVAPWWMSKCGVVTPKAVLSVPPRFGFDSGARIRGEAAAWAAARRALRRLAAPKPPTFRNSRRLGALQAAMAASFHPWPYWPSSGGRMRETTALRNIADVLEDVKDRPCHLSTTRRGDALHAQMPASSRLTRASVAPSLIIHAAPRSSWRRARRSP